MRPARWLLIVTALLACQIDRAALAQNDWQYPDPYFGAIEIEASRSPAAEPRPRRERPPAAQSWQPNRHRQRPLRPRREHVVPQPRR